MNTRLVVADAGHMRCTTKVSRRAGAAAAVYQVTAHDGMYAMQVMAG